MRQVELRSPAPSPDGWRPVRGVRPLSGPNARFVPRDPHPFGCAACARRRRSSDGRTLSWCPPCSREYAGGVKSLREACVTVCRLFIGKSRSAGSSAECPPMCVCSERNRQGPRPRPPSGARPPRRRVTAQADADQLAPMDERLARPHANQLDMLAYTRSVRAIHSRAAAALAAALGMEPAPIGRCFLTS